MTTDLIIIGGGVLGTFHAYHALKKGLSVRLFEKDDRPRGASTQNFGQIVPSGMNPKWQAFGRKSLDIYRELQRLLDISLRQKGSVYLASNVEEMILLEELAHINKENGYPSQLLSSSQCLTRYPGLRKDYCCGGLFFPEEISLDPRVMVSRVLKYLEEEMGLNYHPGTQIREVLAPAVRDTQNRTYKGHKILVCSGNEFKALFPEQFAKSDLLAVKLQMMETLPQPGLVLGPNILTGLSIRRYESFQECPSYPEIAAREEADSLWKKWGVHILFKQREDGSMIIGDSHHYQEAATADQLGMDIEEDITRYILQEAQKIFDLPTYKLRRQWIGKYSQCKQRDIYQEEIEDHVYVLTGIGGKGMTAGPGYAAWHLEKILA